MRPSTLQLLFFSSFFSCLNERGIEAMVLVRSSTLSKHDGCVCVGPLTPAHTSADRAARRGGGFRRITEPPRPCSLSHLHSVTIASTARQKQMPDRFTKFACTVDTTVCGTHHTWKHFALVLSPSLFLSISLYIYRSISLFIGLSE